MLFRTRSTHICTCAQFLHNVVLDACVAGLREWVRKNRPEPTNPSQQAMITTHMTGRTRISGKAREGISRANTNQHFPPALMATGVTLMALRRSLCVKLDTCVRAAKASQRNLPGHGAALRLKQERQNQPLWQESYRDPVGPDVGDIHAANPDGTFEGEDDPGTESCHDDPEVDRENREGGKSGWRPQLKDL
jgi:hypothetical protein